MRRPRLADRLARMVGEYLCINLWSFNDFRPIYTSANDGTFWINAGNADDAAGLQSQNVRDRVEYDNLLERQQAERNRSRREHQHDQPSGEAA